ERLREDVVERQRALLVVLLPFLLGRLRLAVILSIGGEPALVRRGPARLAVAHVGSGDADALAKFARLVTQLLIGQLRDLFLEVVDFVDERLVAPQLALGGIAGELAPERHQPSHSDRKSTRLNSS